MEKLNRAAKCSILGPQNLGSGGGARAPGAPPLDPRLDYQQDFRKVINNGLRQKGKHCRKARILKSTIDDQKKK